jgi:hypothetical protein
VPHTGWLPSAFNIQLILFISRYRKKFIISKTNWYSAFHETLTALLALHKEIVLPPSTEPPIQIIGEDKRWPYFADCIGALDGSHIPVHVVGGYTVQAPWRNRKGFLSQNILAVVDFDMNFTYVLPGWEGAAHDTRVLNSAKEKGFGAPEGKYYLADAGYSNTPLTLVPYRGVRYHLREQALANMKPKTKEELFNLRHSSLRNVVERVFGVFKRRFKIFDRAPQYAFKTQVKLVYALTALHNFINRHGATDLTYLLDDEELDGQSAGSKGEVVDSREMNERRESIATLMWADYLKIIGSI